MYISILESRRRLLDMMCEPGGIVRISCSCIQTKKGSFVLQIEKYMLLNSLLSFCNGRAR